MELVDDVGTIPGIEISLWYLDDGTFVGTRQTVKMLLDALLQHGPFY